MQSDPQIDNDEIFDEGKWNALYRRRQEQRVAASVKYFREHEIEPIVFKGWAVGRYYPLSLSRTASDTDIAVSGEDYQRSVALASAPEGRRLIIDVHDEFRNLDTIPWSSIFDRCDLISAEDIMVRVPCLEDHIRIVSVHWLLDGGAYKKKLWDMYYMVSERTGSFDWELCLDAAGPVRRRWVECAIGLAQKYLGLDLTDTPISNAADRLPDWLVRTVEREWLSDHRLEPLHAHVNSPSKLLRQIGYRVPPNPIHATVAMNGEIDSNGRYFYQISDFLSRIPSAILRSVKRIRK